MRYGLGVFTIAALLLSSTACNEGRYTTAGFQLPRGGDVERGKAAFVELGCSGCHKVSRADVPGPTVVPVVPVKLGGESTRRLSDAYLVTAMLNPDYHLAPSEEGGITAGGHSRMPAYIDKMSARQMVDVVAFLQSRYVIRPLTPDPLL
jgi:L-cysteine S-thiosulfotransferase